MQKITPNLWFKGNAKEAVDFYASVFPEVKINSTANYPETQEEGLADFQLDLAGDVLTIDFEIMDTAFIAVNAGAEFTPNPSVSFFVTLNSKEQMEEVWKKLSEGGKELMPLGEYPFSKYYGWIEDKYNVSWQLILNNPEGEARPKVMTSLLFTQDKNGKAEEALKFYKSVFKDAKMGGMSKRELDDPMAKAGTLAYGEVLLGDTWVVAMDGGEAHAFTFNEGVSLMISCKDQEEIDYFWDALTSNGGEESVCGWLKDQFGVSWQVTPENIAELMSRPDAFKTMMKQKKIIISEY